MTCWVILESFRSSLVNSSASNLYYCNQFGIKWNELNAANDNGRQKEDPADNQETILMYKSHLQRNFADIYIGRPGLVKFCGKYFKLVDVLTPGMVQPDWCLLSPCPSHKIYWGKWRVRMSDCNWWSLLLLLLKCQISSHLHHRLWLSLAQERWDIFFLPSNGKSLFFKIESFQGCKIKINRNNFPRMLLQHYIIWKYLFIFINITRLEEYFIPSSCVGEHKCIAIFN